MKYFILLLLSFTCATIGHAQIKNGGKLVTTTVLPEGTTVTNGAITVRPGYKAILSSKDNKVVLIQRTSKTRMGAIASISGSFSCSCAKDNLTNDCAPKIRDGGTSVYCKGIVCTSCDIDVNIDPKAGAGITRETKGEIWKRFVYPGKTEVKTQ